MQTVQWRWLVSRGARRELQRRVRANLFILWSAGAGALGLALVCLYGHFGRGLGALEAQGAGAAMPAGSRRSFSAEKFAFQGKSGTFEVQATATGVEITPIKPRTARAGKSGPTSALRGAPAKVETIFIARGGDARAEEASGHVVVEGDDRILIERGNSVEELHDAGEGVEQRWIFERSPEGTGDLVVRLRVSGQEHAGETTEELRFTDPSSGLGVRCGPATWVDARGVKTSVMARYSGGEIELRVAEATLDASVYPAVLDPIWEPVIEAIAAPSPTSVVGDDAFQGFPSVAFGQVEIDPSDLKPGYLAIWLDVRRYPAIRVRGARLNQNGGVLDKTGFTIYEGYSVSPAVTSDGVGYFVVWEGDPAIQGNTYVTKIFGALVDPGGKLVKGPEVIGGAAFKGGGGLSVAFDSSTSSYLVVWSGYEAGVTGPQVKAARVSSQDLTVESTIDVFVSMDKSFGAAIACGGAKCLVTWIDEDTHEVRGALVGPDDSVTAKLSFGTGLINGPYLKPAVSLAGDDYYLVAWTAPGGVAGMRVATDGSLLDSDPIMIASDGEIPALARGAKDKVLATWIAPDPWGIDQAVAWKWVDTATPMNAGQPPEIVDGADYFLSTACGGDGSNCAIVWQQYIPLPSPDNNNEADIRAAYVGDPSLASPFTVTKNLVEQRHPEVTANKENGFILAFATNGFLAEQQVVAFPHSDGFQSPLKFKQPVHDEWYAGPAIAWGNDGGYLVAWAGWDVLGAKGLGIGGSLAINSGSPIVEFIIPATELDSTLSKPAVVFDGAGYLIAWRAQIHDAADAILVARQDASVPSDEAPVTLIDAAQSDSDYYGPPAIAHGGANSMLVWNRSGLYAARVAMVNGELTNLDPGGIKLYQPPPFTFDPDITASPPDVASDGNGSYLVVWKPEESDGAPRIYGSRITQDGIQLDQGFPISPPGASKVCCPRVAFDGHSYLAVWQDLSNGQPRMLSTWVSRRGIVSGVTESGQKVFEVSPTTLWGPASDVASNGEGRSLVAYTRSDFDTGGVHVDVNRIQARYVNNPCLIPKDGVCSTKPVPVCHDPGECLPNPVADNPNEEPYTCSSPTPKADGAECENGLCFNGKCDPDPPAGSGGLTSSGGFESSGSPELNGSGCGCRIAPSPADGAGWASALLAAALGSYARRQRPTRRC